MSGPTLSIQAPFDTLVDQPMVAQFFTAAVAAGSVSHAYVFVGPLGAGKTEAAVQLAKAVLCSKGGCGACDNCIRVVHRTHPDFSVIDPLGATGYLAEQISEVVHDTARAPIRATRKMYLFTRADLLRGTAANALLKTLEEPLGKVTFVLLARTRESLLPTLLSRCQVVPFRRIPEDEAAQSLVERTGVDLAMARRAYAACGGSRFRAEEFLRSGQRREARVLLIEILERLPQSDDLEILRAVRTLFEKIQQPLDAVKSGQRQQLEARKDFLSKGGITQLEQQHRRILTNRERETISEALDITRSWLRDILLVRLGKRNEIVNDDFHFHIERLAGKADEASITRAIIAVDRAQEQIQYNVSKELAIEVLLFALRDEFTHEETGQA